ncbi:extensin-like [Penaeus monodon]|uniref:extensin-like n=1 Tax=Penaeus monodon TaxID=6687 RepID=UPI0018A7CA12|nr:extensin-like [Penaeus monodon]
MQYGNKKVNIPKSRARGLSPPYARPYPSHARPYARCLIPAPYARPPPHARRPCPSLSPRPLPDGPPGRALKPTLCPTPIARRLIPDALCPAFARAGPTHARALCPGAIRRLFPTPFAHAMPPPYAPRPCPTPFARRLMPGALCPTPYPGPPYADALLPCQPRAHARAYARPSRAFCPPFAPSLIPALLPGPFCPGLSPSPFSPALYPSLMPGALAGLSPRLLPTLIPGPWAPHPYARAKAPAFAPPHARRHPEPIPGALIPTPYARAPDASPRPARRPYAQSLMPAPYGPSFWGPEPYARAFSRRPCPRGLFPGPFAHNRNAQTPCPPRGLPALCRKIRPMPTSKSESFPDRSHSDRCSCPPRDPSSLPDSCLRSPRTRGPGGVTYAWRFGVKRLRRIIKVSIKPVFKDTSEAER